MKPICEFGKEQITITAHNFVDFQNALGIENFNFPTAIPVVAFCVKVYDLDLILAAVYLAGQEYRINTIVDNHRLFFSFSHITFRTSTPTLLA